DERPLEREGRAVARVEAEARRDAVHLAADDGDEPLALEGDHDPCAAVRELRGAREGEPPPPVVNPHDRLAEDGESDDAVEAPRAEDVAQVREVEDGEGLVFEDESAEARLTNARPPGGHHALARAAPLHFRAALRADLRRRLVRED